MELTGLASDALANDFRVAVDKDAHNGSGCDGLALKKFLHFSRVACDEFFKLVASERG
jgi:hypothetical protein